MRMLIITSFFFVRWRLCRFHSVEFSERKTIWIKLKGDEFDGDSALCQTQPAIFFTFYKQKNNKNVKTIGDRIWQSVAVKFILLYIKVQFLSLTSKLLS